MRYYALWSFRTFQYFFRNCNKTENYRRRNSGFSEVFFYVNLNHKFQYKIRVFSTLTETGKKCKDCLKICDISALVCPSCLSLFQLPSSVCFYKIFPKSLKVLPPEGDFLIDVKALHKEYLEIQKKIHPDIHERKGHKQRLLSESLTSMLNTAYSTLVDPLSRAHYFLSLHNVSIPDQDEVCQNSELLSEIMELNEKIEEIEVQEDMQLIRKTIDEKIQEEIMKINSGFKILEFETIKQAAIRLKYWMNMKNTLHEKF